MEKMNNNHNYLAYFRIISTPQIILHTFLIYKATEYTNLKKTLLYQ